MKSKQQSFAIVSDEFKDYWKDTGRRVHGGEYAKKKRKTARPFDSTKPMHLILRSSIAEERLSMRWQTNRDRVESIVYKYAKKFHVRIYRFSNNGNHLHIALKAQDKTNFQKYLRTITGLIARFILKAEKGKEKGKFWDTLAFTRIADWGKSFTHLSNYIWQNLREAAGLVPYKPRAKNQKSTSATSRSGVTTSSRPAI